MLIAGAAAKKATRGELARVAVMLVISSRSAQLRRESVTYRLYPFGILGPEPELEAERNETVVSFTFSHAFFPPSVANRSRV